MNKYFIVILIIVLLLMSSCSVQKNVSPRILTERISEKSTDIILENQEFYYKGDFIVFAKYKEVDIVIKMKTDDKQNVCKISVSIAENIKEEDFKDLISLLINVYTPDEDKNEILNELINKNLVYYHGKEHVYSLIKDKNIYFEIINIPLSGYTYPDLTLKPNDRQDF